MMKYYNQLTKAENDVIEGKATEPAFSGEYHDFFKNGTYICKRCNNPIFSSKSKFDAGSGWPSFDENFPNAVKKTQDPDFIRTMILCSNCGAHLGHVFQGEGYTKKDTRHCANSLALRFISKNEELPKVIK